MSNTAIALFVLFLAILWPLIRIVKEIPIYVDDLDAISGRSIYNDRPSHDHKRINEFYSVIDLKAPALAGPLLNVLSYVVARSFLSPFILRHLLDENGLHGIRELAARECQNLPPTYFPVHKADVTTEIRNIASLHKNFLHTGLDMKVDHESNNANGGWVPYGIMDYHKLYLSGKATPSQVMEEIILGAKKLEHLRIFSSFRPDDIRKQALQSDQRWKHGKPLSVFDGVPVAMKDMIAVAGHRLCYGSMLSACKEMHEDDVLSRRLREAGAIHIGGTVMTEGGVTPLGYAKHFDGPFNPYSLDHYTGGSSGGSAVAVASGLIPMAIGFDGGGSVRVPAACSGTIGLATTYGRLPVSDPGKSTMVKGGPLAATLEDVALTHLLLGPSEPGTHSTELIGDNYIPPPHLSSVVDNDGKAASLFQETDNSQPLRGTRLGIFWDHFMHTDPEVHEVCMKAVRHLESLGAEVVNVTIPYLREIHLSHGIKILSEFALFWEAKFFNPNFNLEPNTEITIALGRTVTAAEVLAADTVRTFAMKKVCKELFQELELDAIVSPMLGSKVPKPRPGYRGYGENDNSGVYKLMRFVPLANLLGLPALSVPVGYEAETNLPISFQLLGDAWTEHNLMKIGMFLEQSTGRRKPPAENFYDTLKNFL